MANAGILVGGTLVRTTYFTEITYNHREGFITKFTYREKTYIHITTVNFLIQDANTIGTAGYFEEQAFLKYRVKEIKREEISGFQLHLNQLEKGVKDDTIVVHKLNIKSPYTNFCEINKISWTYTGGEVLTTDGKIKIPEVPIATIEEKKVAMHSIAIIFYQRNLPFLNDLSSVYKDQAAYLLALIAIQINNIQLNVFPLFAGEIELQSYITSQNTEWQFNDAFSDPTIDDFKQYLANITAFYSILYANQIAVKKANKKTKLFWLGYVLTAEALAIVPTVLKVEMLQNICYGPVIESSMLIELISFAFSPLSIEKVKPIIDMEEVVLRIIKSVLFSPTQFDDFLNRLTAIYEADEGRTLFQFLYEKVDDEWGSDNLKTMMDSFYRIWASSSLYPYNIDGTVKNNLINPAAYANKPIDIGYEAGTVAFFFNSSNFDFYYRKSEITVVEPTEVIMEQVTYTQNVLIGDYDIYQSISINSKDADVGSSTFTFIEVQKENNQIEQLSVLPIFYLKYLDDKKRTENLKTGLKLTVDVVLTLSLVGNLSKLRHLRSVYKLGRVALGLEPLVPGTVLASFEFARGVLGVVEITASLGSIFIEYGKQIPTYCTVGSTTYDKDKCEFYTKLNGWFLALQILAPTLDFATSKLVSNSAKRILEGPIPNDFDSDALGILRRVAGDTIIELKQVFKERLRAKFGDDSPTWLKLQEFGSAKQEEFIMDFSKAEDRVLEALNLNNGELIDVWKDIEGFENLRRDTFYLRRLGFVKKQANFNAHLTIGELNGTKFFNPPNGNIINYRTEGIHTLRPPVPDNMLFTVTIPPKHTEFYKIKVRIKGPDGWSNPLDDNNVTKFYAAEKESTCFPNSWTMQKIQQETAAILLEKGLKKGVHNPENGLYKFDGIMSDGTKIRVISKEDGTLVSAFPVISKNKF